MAKREIVPKERTQIKSNKFIKSGEMVFIPLLFHLAVQTAFASNTHTRACMRKQAHTAELTKLVSSEAAFSSFQSNEGFEKHTNKPKLPDVCI